MLRSEYFGLNGFVHGAPPAAGMVTHSSLAQAFTNIFQQLPEYDMAVKGPPILNVDLNSQVRCPEPTPDPSLSAMEP